MKKVITKEELKELKELFYQAKKYNALMEDRMDDIADLFDSEDMDDIDWLWDAVSDEGSVHKLVNHALKMMKVTIY